MFDSRLYDPSQWVIIVDIFGHSQWIIIVDIIWSKSMGYNSWPYDPSQRVIRVDLMAPYQRVIIVDFLVLFALNGTNLKLTTRLWSDT